MTPGVTVAETIDLDVPLERAWEFVADFEKFPDWFVLHEGFPAGPPPSLEEVREGTSITEEIKVMGIDGNGDEHPRPLRELGRGPHPCHPPEQLLGRRDHTQLPRWRRRPARPPPSRSRRCAACSSGRPRTRP
jgi:hypothetical protein